MPLQISTQTRREALALAAGIALTAPLGSAAVAAVPADDLSGPWTGGGDISTVGGKLHYATLGPDGGEPLVLLPKLGGWIADWRFAAADLAKTRRVIAFDLPGHGGSIMAAPPPYVVSVPEIAAMILAALDEMRIDRCAFGGNSLGGVVGIVAAACWPERVSKLVIVSSSLIGAMTREAVFAQDHAAPDPNAPSSYTKAGEPLPPTAEQNRLFGTMDPRVIREQALSRAKAGLWLRSCERGVGRGGVTDYLPRIKVPTLMINADRGRYVKYIDVGKRLIPNVQAVVIRQAGSFVHQEKPAEVARAMNAFLDG
jgi:pimeloyl-ACP methyl ester carboxylesterase